jgi:hypothetical protein
MDGHERAGGTLDSDEETHMESGPAGLRCALIGVAACAAVLGCAGRALRGGEGTADGGAAAAGAGGVAGIEGAGGTAGGAGGAGGKAGAPGCGSCGPLEQCWNGRLCVAKLVPVTGGYSIDATEVTRSQYEAWLATSPTTSGQPAYCSWNTSLAPAASCMVSFLVCQGSNCGNHPEVCVDWCDAYAYCKAVGKRLCGRIGGGPNAYADWWYEDRSQWFNACSSGGPNAYPYGEVPSGSACNGKEASTGTTVPVGTMIGCASSSPGYQGVYDLAGNVGEWEDSCSGASGATDFCRVRGGSFMEELVYLQCNIGGHLKRTVVDGFLGIRCCSP